MDWWAARSFGRRRRAWRKAIFLLGVALPAAFGGAPFAGTTAYTYDVLGRVVSATYANGAVITYTYDPAGNRTQQVINPSTPPPVVQATYTTTVQYQSTGNVLSPTITGAVTGLYPTSLGPGYGSLTVNGGSFVYSAPAGYSGPDSFSYYASNIGGNSNTGTVNVTVNPQLPAVAASFPITVGYESSYTYTPTITGGAAGGLTLVTGSQEGGSVSVSGLSLIYTAPSYGYSGQDSFSYYASNAGGRSNTGTVNVTVNPQPPVANTINVNVPVGYTDYLIPVSPNVTGGAPTGLSVSTDSHATVQPSFLTSIYYTPNNGFTGPTDQFTYTVSNGGGSSTAYVNVTIGHQPSTFMPLYDLNMNTTTNTITPLYSGGGTATALQIVTQPQNGTLTINSNLTFNYAPRSGYYGNDSFIYTASNAYGTSTQAYGDITVMPPAVTANPVTAGPFAYGSTADPVAPNVSGGTVYTLAITTQPANGTAAVNGSGMTYSPKSTFFGTDTFQYTAKSQIVPSAASVTVTVNPPAPVVTSPPTLTVSADSITNSVPLNFAYMGTQMGPSSVTVTTLPLHGTATATGTAITYSPYTAFAGTDTFAYTGTNAGGTSLPTTATIAVSGVADGTVLATQSTPGAFSYTVPAGVAFIDIEGWGSGYPGWAVKLGGTTSAFGGGGGGYFIKHIAVSAGQVISGSIPTTAPLVAGAGTNPLSPQAAATTITSPALTANSGYMRTGGTATGGDTNVSGDNCCIANAYAGGGAGNGGGDQNALAGAGTAPGGGGAYGGSGANGQIRITARTS
jgi:YD repeat-containing protein